MVTSGKWEVMEVLGFNAKRKSIIIASNECSPIQRNIFVVDTKTGKRTMMDDCGKGWHNATLSENGQFIYDNYSTPTVPRKIAIVNTENGKRTAHRINLNSSDILTSPYFYVQQNDYIYVTPNKIRQDNSKYNQNNAFKLSVISTIVSACSVVASLVIALAIK